MRENSGMRCIIVSGGHIEDAFAFEWLEKNEYDCLIAADAGMNFLYRNKITPDIIAGDFDSVDEKSLKAFSGDERIEILRLNPIKDDTDTEYVIREAICRGATEITLLGATGTRLDHVLANVNLLGIGLQENVKMQIVDAHNRIRMIEDSLEFSKENQFGKYVSILAVKGDARGVTLDGFKYPLRDANLRAFSSLGISNEIIESKANILVKEGYLLVIESRD